MMKRILKTFFPNVISVTSLSTGTLYTVATHFDVKPHPGAEFKGDCEGFGTGR